MELVADKSPLCDPGYIDEVGHHALRMVDEVEWVGLFGAEDESFAREVTPRLRRQRTRSSIKKLIEVSVARIRDDITARLLIDRDILPAAARLVNWAIKQWLLQNGNTWLRGRALILQFAGIDAPWIEDLTRPQSLFE